MYAPRYEEAFRRCRKKSGLGCFAPSDLPHYSSISQSLLLDGVQSCCLNHCEEGTSEKMSAVCSSGTHTVACVVR